MLGSTLLDRTATLVEEWTLTSLEQVGTLLLLAGRFLARWAPTRIRCMTLMDTLWRKKTARVLPYEVNMQVEHAYFATLPPKFTVHKLVQKEREKRHGGRENAYLASHPLVSYLEKLLSEGKSETDLMSKLQKLDWKERRVRWMVDYVLTTKVQFPSLGLLARLLCKLSLFSVEAAKFVTAFVDDLLYRIAYSSLTAPGLWGAQRRSWDISLLVECIVSGLVPLRTWFDTLLFLLRVPSRDTAKEDAVFRFRMSVSLAETLFHPNLASVDWTLAWVQLPLSAFFVAATQLAPLPLDLQISVENILERYNQGKQPSVAELAARIAASLDKLSLALLSKTSTAVSTTSPHVAVPQPILKYASPWLLPFPKLGSTVSPVAWPILWTADVSKTEEQLKSLASSICPATGTNVSQVPVEGADDGAAEDMDMDEEEYGDEDDGEEVGEDHEERAEESEDDSDELDDEDEDEDDDEDDDLAELEDDEDDEDEIDRQIREITADSVRDRRREWKSAASSSNASNVLPARALLQKYEPSATSATPSASASGTVKIALKGKGLKTVEVGENDDSSLAKMVRERMANAKKEQEERKQQVLQAYYADEAAAASAAANERAGGWRSRRR
jgi:hypothetical protein